MKKPNSLSNSIADFFTSICLFVVYLFLFGITLVALCAILVGDVSNLHSSVPLVCVLLSLGLSGRLTHLTIKKRRANRVEEYDRFTQNEKAKSILDNIDICLRLTNEATDVTLFVKWYDEILDGYKQLMELDKAEYKTSPSLSYYRYQDEFQWHLCDAIVRSKEHVISEMVSKYKHCKERKVRVADNFSSDIEEMKPRFSPDTAELAEEAVAEVRRAAGILTVEKKAPPHSASEDPFEKYGGVEAALLSIDLMDGEQFEHWCADLLRTIGFADVVVTKKSGDQGVDVLAKKDGIRYAIQCKCYSSDLGNGPVQEVNTGKVIYKCHVGVVLTNQHFTSGAKEAADATGVLLWDRDWITQQLKNK